MHAGEEAHAVIDLVVTGEIEEEEGIDAAIHEGGVGGGAVVIQAGVPVIPGAPSGGDVGGVEAESPGVVFQGEAGGELPLRHVRDGVAVAAAGEEAGAVAETYGDAGELGLGPGGAGVEGQTEGRAGGAPEVVFQEGFEAGDAGVAAVAGGGEAAAAGGDLGGE